MDRGSDRPMRLRDRTALITGSSRGIGEAIALGMAKEGADAIVNYSSRSEAVEKVAYRIRSEGRKALAVQADVGDSDSVKRMADLAIEAFHHLDILVNNAGVILWRYLAKVTEQEWEKVVNRNLTGVFHCTKSVLPHMTARNFGKIINISSAFAFHGLSGSVAYSAAKSALLGFTRTLAKEVGPRGITVNALSPGYILTELTRQASDEEKAQLISDIPLRRGGLPEDIDNAAVFPASEEASYITGQVIKVDGGWKI
ncbi:MAG: 3-oxoacyl-ACP reductase family protein [Thermodesulfobacteriota bacterium]